MDESTAPTPTADVPASPAVEDNSLPASPASEPTTSVTTEPVAQETSTEVTAPAAPVADESGVTEPQPSRLERRIETVEAKRNGYDNLLGNLKQLRDQSSAPVPAVPQPRLSELVQGRDSLDPSELDQLGQQVAQASTVNADLKYQQLANRMVMNEFINDTEKQAAVVESRYDELKDGNPAKDVLEPKIQARFQREALIPNPLNPRQLVINPNAPRLEDIAAEEVQAWRQAVEQGKAQTSATLATQADNSAVTPTSDTVPEKSVDDMSVEEHEAYLKAKGYNL